MATLKLNKEDLSTYTFLVLELLTPFKNSPIYLYDENVSMFTNGFGDANNIKKLNIIVYTDTSFEISFLCQYPYDIKVDTTYYDVSVKPLKMSENDFNELFTYLLPKVIEQFDLQDYYGYGETLNKVSEEMTKLEIKDIIVELISGYKEWVTMTDAAKNIVKSIELDGKFVHFEKEEWEKLEEEGKTFPVNFDGKLFMVTEELKNELEERKNKG